MKQLASTIQNTPIITFTIILLVILTIPPVFEKIKIPGLVGLLFAGVIFGSDGLGFFKQRSRIDEIFSRYWQNLFNRCGIYL